MLIRGAAQCAWSVGVRVADDVARELEELARQEPPVEAWEQPPLHTKRYHSLLPGRVTFGPAFEFPPSTFEWAPLATEGHNVKSVHDEASLNHHFSGWGAGEIEAGAAPVLAVFDGNYPVSACFCARRSSVAAEAGLETAPAFRGQGYAPQVVAAWAVAVRESGRTPLYSTAWTNTASLSVARKLELTIYATDWSIA